MVDEQNGEMMFAPENQPKQNRNRQMTKGTNEKHRHRKQCWLVRKIRQTIEDIRSKQFAFKRKKEKELKSTDTKLNFEQNSLALNVLLYPLG